MQVDRRPTRGPYVAALVCLLTLCLTIPFYWQSQAERARKRTATNEERLTATLGGNFVRLDRVPMGYGWRRRGDESIDTLDELLFQLANRPGGIANSQGDVFTELLGAPEPGIHDSAEPPVGVISQYASAFVHYLAVKLASFKPAERLVAIAVDYWRSDATEGGHDETPRTFSLTLASPSDRLAMLPTRPLPRDVSSVEAFSSPWCPPTSLMERLSVLAEQPYSAAWAEQTIAEIRALTDTDRPSTAATHWQLQRLTELTSQALPLANDAGEDCLRAELLRAHWGLARRLECWSLMRDIAVASAAENRFAARESWDTTSSVLVGQGTQPADLQSLSGDLEDYEQTRQPRLARAILQRQRLLAAANDVRQRELANQIEQNYRNANVRLALSAELLQRFIPRQSEEMSTVHDRIAGTPVHGHSITNSENKVDLEPDAECWHVNLESDGTVDSDTVADGGSVRLHTLGTTAFTARKSLMIERDGVNLGDTSADAHNTSRLVGVRSDFDWMPLVNNAVRDRAVDEYHKKRPRAKAEIECKIAGRVEQQLDERASTAVDKVQGQMRDQVTGPLASAGVELTPIELSTTKQRVIARLRVAGADQLGGHTPRPRAPADSLASVQVHESALTNAAVSLGLDGKRLAAPELQALIREKFARTDQPPAVQVKSDTIFDFAAEDAVRFRIADQKLELVLAMREVSYEGDPVRNFRVHAFYAPVLNGLEAEFVRVGPLGIEGRIGTGERARMHGIFNKVLSEDRKLPIVRLNDAQDARLAGLMITQLVLEDGWVGLAIGPSAPERTAELSRMLR